MNIRWAAIAALVAAGCGDKDDTGGSFDYTQFEAGSFTFTSIAVVDACLDGAFTTLFLPEGAGTENDWAYPIELPAWDSLPATYEIQLQDPFSNVEVTVEEGGAGIFALDGVQQLGVQFDDSIDDCFVDLDIAATLSIDSSDALTGSAGMTVDNPTGKECPPDLGKQAPCEVTLEFYATRN